MKGYAMSLIKVTNLTFAYEGSYDNIFENVSFQMDTDWKLGFVGRNGRGKTTFLRLLCGDYAYAGSIHANVAFEYFPYAVTVATRTAREVITEVCTGYTEWALARELNLLEVDKSVLTRPFETLSGGERTKLLLAALFLRENYFLLIDEPTNHLDAHGRALVSRYLNTKRGYILVSHDRAFLDGCADHILSINRANIEIERGNFSSWLANKERCDAHELAENTRLKKDIKRLESAARQSHQWADKVESTKMGRGAAKLRKKGHIGAGTMTYHAEKSRRLQQRRKNIERRQNAALEEKSTLLKNIDRADTLKISQSGYHTSRLVELNDVAIYYSVEIITTIGKVIMTGCKLSTVGREAGAENSEAYVAGSKEDTLSSEIFATSNKASASGIEKNTATSRALKPVCQGITFTIERGDRVALQGKNGSGKSSILKLICGEFTQGGMGMNPLSANLYTAEHSPINPTPANLIFTGGFRRGSQLRISYVSQETATLQGSLTDYAAAHAIDESLFKAILRKLGFSRTQFDKDLRDFSAGQKKKALLARSLCENAHLLVWDEPLNFVDVLSRMQIEELLLTYKPTIIFVEHDKIFCERVATKRVVL